MKKGFTLVELLSVIAILGVISLITIPIVSSVIRNGKVKSYEAQVGIIIDASKKWVLKNDNYLSEEKPIYLTVNKLISSGTIEQEVIINPITNEEMNGCVKVSYSSLYQQYDYEYISDCSSYLVKYNDGSAINFNPETGSLCDNPSVGAGSKTGCLKFYAFNDSEDELSVNMILANNSTPLVAYALQSDYEAAGGTNFSSNGSSLGGLTVKAKLASDTQTWMKEFNPRLLNIKDLEKLLDYRLLFNAFGNSYVDGTVSSSSSTSPSSYGWLFGNLYDTTTYGGIDPINVSYPSRYYDTKSDTNVEMWNYQLGYWLEDIYNPTQGRAINNTGLITHSEGWIYNYYGVRPVITVPKTILN